MTPKARTVTAPPVTCQFPIGGETPCGNDATWQVPWKLLHGYEDRTDMMPLCPVHAARFPDVAPL